MNFIRIPVTTGSVTFREFIVGYTDTFQRSYVGIAKGDWRVNTPGTSDLDDWDPDTGAGITVVSAMSSLLTSGTPKTGDDAVIQVLGPSYRWENQMIYTP